MSHYRSNRKLYQQKSPDHVSSGELVCWPVWECRDWLEVSFSSCSGCLVSCLLNSDVHHNLRSNVSQSSRPQAETTRKQHTVTGRIVTRITSRWSHTVDELDLYTNPCQQSFDLMLLKARPQDCCLWEIFGCSHNLLQICLKKRRITKQLEATVSVCGDHVEDIEKVCRQKSYKYK